MTRLYEVLYNLPQVEAMEAVKYRVEAAEWHDQAEKFEDEKNFSKSEEFWSLAEKALKRHFEILLKYIERREG